MGKSLQTITPSSSGFGLTSALAVPSFGDVAGLCMSMEPLTSRTSAYFPLVSWAKR